MRNMIAVGFVILGIGLAAASLYHHQPVTALASVLAGIAVGLAVFFGMMDSIENPVFQAAAIVIGAIGIVGIFLYSSAFASHLQGAYPEVVSRLETLESMCQPLSPALRNLREFGMRAYTVQGNADQMSALIELQKGVDFGPMLTLADSAVALKNSAQRNYSAQVFRAADAQCPVAFQTMSGAERKALVEAAAP